MQSSTFRWSWLVWFAFILCAANTLAYILITAAPQIKADVWRHLHDVVIPFIEGEKDFRVLWSNHHPIPLLHLIQVFNFHNFDMRLDIDAYIGFFFQLVCLAMLVRHMLRTVNAQGSAAIFTAFAVFTVLAIGFGFNSPVQYRWPLVMIQQYLYFFGLLLIFQTERCLYAESRSQHILIALVVLAFSFANLDFAIIFFVALLVVLALAFLVERTTVYLRVIATIVLAIAAYRVALALLGIEMADREGVEPLWLVTTLLTELPRVFLLVSVAMAYGVVDLAKIAGRFSLSDTAVLLLVMPFGFVYFGVMLVSLFKGVQRRTIVPLALMAYAALFALSALVYRFDLATHDIWLLTEERYGPNYKWGAIGLLWSCCLLFGGGSSAVQKGLRAVFVLACCLVLLQQIGQLRMVWHWADYQRDTHYGDGLAIVLAADLEENSLMVPRRIRYGFEETWEFGDTLQYLKREQLNVFSSQYPENPKLAAYRHARRQFQMASENTPVLELAGPRPVSEALNAHWQLDSQGGWVTNRDQRPLYLRLGLSRDTHAPGRQNFSVSIGEHYRDQFHAEVGVQYLYFEIPAGKRFQLDLDEGTTIKAAQIIAGLETGELSVSQ